VRGEIDKDLKNNTARFAPRQLGYFPQAQEITIEALGRVPINAQIRGPLSDANQIHLLTRRLTGSDPKLPLA
jgi:hypothetical protein